MAVRKVVTAITDFHGSDCLLYAYIGAGALQTLGVDATVVAGSAAWRVGPGDPDTVSHAAEVEGQYYAAEGATRAALFHAWVEAPGLLVDFSTHTLRMKAQELDRMDGRNTQVDWAPDFLWLTPSTSQGRLPRPQQVVQAPGPGVFSYVRHPEIEKLALSHENVKGDFFAAIQSAVMAYQAALAGNQIEVHGFDPDTGKIQTSPEPRTYRKV